jgi:hypothetical protein
MSERCKGVTAGMGERPEPSLKKPLKAFSPLRERQSRETGSSLTRSPRTKSIVSIGPRPSSIPSVCSRTKRRCDVTPLKVALEYYDDGYPKLPA